jgi:uncharacterized iron-regulated membrane protein
MRKVFFWLHLTAGSVAGIVILIMSVTGVLLTYEKQMMAWADQREYRVAPPPDRSRLPMETLLEKVRERRGALPATVAVSRNAETPVMFSYGREDNLYLNPYTGEILGSGAPGVRRFFVLMTEWHRYVGAGLDNRAAGKLVTGVCNAAFLFLVVSGFYLWLPRVWSAAAVRAVVWFRRGLPGKARDFNWHNVIGVWCAVPLFFVVLGATVISFPWASNLAYRIAGSEPPPAGAKGGLAKGGFGKEGGKKGRKGEARPSGPAGLAPPPADLNIQGLETAWRRAEQQTASWRTVTLRLPASDRAPWAFTIDQGTAGQPQYRGMLTVARDTGEVVRWETYSSYDAGRRFRTWLRFVHTGEYYGLIGQTIAGIASLGGAVLVYTGLALAWRRFFAWRKRRKSAPVEETVEYSVR